MRIYRLFLMLTVYAISLSSANAQKITNVKAGLAGSKIIVTYDLESDDPNKKFDVELYSSHDGYSTPMLLVKGDAGRGILPGQNKKVEWNARAEIGNFDGNIIVELRAAIVKPLFTFSNPVAGDSYRRGKGATITWEGGSENMRPRLFLFKDNEQVQSIGQVSNNGIKEWIIPDDTPKGKGYTIRMSYGDESIDSAPFAIKSKVPFGLKALAVPLIGGVGYLIINAAGGESASDLPVPPDPGG